MKVHKKYVGGFPQNVQHKIFQDAQQLQTALYVIRLSVFMLIVHV
jgi:hypothetical protein